MAGVTTSYQTGNHAGRPAAGAGCILYSCTDHDKVYRSDGTTWTDWLVVSSGSTSLDAILAASSGEDIADALAGAAAPDAGNVFATMADVGGGGDLTRLSEQVLGAAAANITETGISSAYRDLVIVIRGRSATANTKELGIRFGDGSIDTGSNYTNFRSYNGTIGSGSVSNTSGAYGSIGAIPGSGSNAASFGGTRIEILGYSSSEWKTWMGQSYSTASDGTLASETKGTWMNSSGALDQIRVYDAGSGNNLEAGSRLVIYGRA